MVALKDVRWALLLVTGLGTLVFMLFADVVFVTYYGQLTNPGQTQAFYTQFAEDTAGAFVFVFAPFPVYIVTRWLCGKVHGHYFLHAVLLVASYYLFVTIMTAAMGTWESMLMAEYWLNMGSMLAGALAGAYFAGKARQDHAAHS